MAGTARMGAKAPLPAHVEEKVPRPAPVGAVVLKPVPAGSMPREATRAPEVPGLVQAGVEGQGREVEGCPAAPIPRPGLQSV